MEFETLSDMKRTNMCGELNASDENKEVVLMGWVAKKQKTWRRKFCYAA